MGEATSARVTSQEHRIDCRIARQTEASIAYFSGKLDQIECRLAELDEEWHLERALQFNAGVIGLAGLAFGFIWRRWLAVPMVMLGCLVRFAVQGWTPGAGLLRRLGLRTMREIEYERHALKTIRGDSAQGPPQPTVSA